MKKVFLIMVLTVVIANIGCGPSASLTVERNNAGIVDNKDIQKKVESLQQQLNTLNERTATLQQDVNTLQADLKKAFNQIRSIRQAQAGTTPKKPAAEADMTVYDLSVGSSAVKGPADAPVTIVEFVDLQCPYCVKEYPKIKRILARYPDTVKYVFKHFPLAFHKKAKPAHVAAEYVLREGGMDKFWQFHDQIMAEPRKLDPSDLRAYVQNLELDMAGYDKLMAQEEDYDPMLKADIDLAKKCKVRGTPTVFINGLKLSDRSIKGYETRIDQILKDKK
ncbi:MAG: thioredoxin domain-containing protein [Sedimentisphaerales bacterium]|nr:thioredoxin domain-containing protein [Sedimentisphaerales bacterium]